MSHIESQNRVLSGMRPTGKLHLGHYHGVLKNWIKLQYEFECMFFVADWHALTTHYEDPSIIEENVWGMVLDWLAAGVNPGSATLFVQSKIPEHAELHLLLSMITPVGWLERVPSYKDLQMRINEKDLATYGFLGYPVLQSSDILIYTAGHVPVGADQAAHVELTRELARRFNHIYGREPGFEKTAEAAIKKMGRKNARLFRNLRTEYLEKGNQEALETARALLRDQPNISMGDSDRLYGYLEGGGKMILPEPETLLTDAATVPGLDGQKMSKSYGNTIALREDPKQVQQKIKTMVTDPARVRRSDPGNPEKCPVFGLHKIYSDDATNEWIREGCTGAGIGCLDCKKPLIEAVLAEQQPMLERAKQYEENPDLVKSIIAEGCENARTLARSTLDEVRQAMGMDYR
ncbi:MAG: tryptophan--tRNA ligase [Pseudomonadales bacterium]|nr:tryptophan--tRNA ligase [Pseudomonadales bacterium]MDP7595435.1 tryptophan--tRNA ligase [Pseudomonadales bacterium]HJN49668.1 tryptophan--tRNA ligase [Pseudomonadales bacterium]